MGRTRPDSSTDVQDWYPCGVACCAGELVTLRSTNGGSTWTTLERKLAKGRASFVDGAELLSPTASGTIQAYGTSESTVVDSFGVERGGAFGPKMISTAYPLRNDVNVEKNLAQLQISFRMVDARSDCFAVYRSCLVKAQGVAGACVAGVMGTAALWVKRCGLIPIPQLKAACYLAAGAYVGAGLAGCWIIKDGEEASCRQNLRECLEKNKPKPTPVKPTPIRTPIYY